jgi:hypothetical protein
VREITPEQRAEWRASAKLTTGRYGIRSSARRDGERILALLDALNEAETRAQEAEEDRDRNYESYIGACRQVAEMHEAAMGEITGPHAGVVEDIRNNRLRAVAAEAENKRLRQALAGHLFDGESLSTREAIREELITEGLKAMAIVDRYVDLYGTLDEDETVQ